MDKYKNIPKTLKQLNQWVCYALVYDKKRNKYSKTPNTGYNAKSNDHSTWSSYEVALNVIKKYGFDGIGFELGNGILGIDLDEAINSGNISPKAKHIIETLDSYTEISPSGKGLHILCKGEIPTGNRRKGNVEMYSKDRFFTVTGNSYGNKNKIEKRTDQAKLIHDKYLKNYKQLDDLFKQSGLYRPKWDRQDYKRQTIEKLLQDVKILFMNAKNISNLAQINMIHKKYRHISIKK